MATSEGRRLQRASDGRPAAPVRIVHLGVGNFFRAHQAWYTEHASDAPDWGISAFTGRSPAVADQLSGQDGLYTLLTRAESGPRAEVVAALAEVSPGADVERLQSRLASPEVAVVTLTVTEAGYGPGSSVPGRLVAGLSARRRADAGPIAVVPCDNVPDNGALVRRVVTELARAGDPSLAAWIEESVSFVSTVVDRITPRATDSDRTEVRALTGVDDPAVVVTEAFTEWVLAGELPAGRPDWAGAGARLVDDAAPFETRKLWLLNGAHSLLAYAGSLLGHELVSEAIADPLLRGWVEEWWDCAGARLALPAEEVSAYRAALLERFANPAIRHLLAQIAMDGSQKVPIRVLPVLRMARDEGELPSGATRLLAAWIAHVRGHGAPVHDVEADALRAKAAGSAPGAVAAVLDHLGVHDAEVARLVAEQLRELEALAATSDRAPGRGQRSR